MMLRQEQFVCREDYPQVVQPGWWMSLGYQDLLPGGKAAGMSPRDFDPVQLAIGTRVELEHTTSSRVAREIAMDHLAEDPDYYRKLRTIHLDGASLGGTREDIISKLAIVVGTAKATETVDRGISFLRYEAGVGAERKVKPLMIAAIAAGALGLTLGAISLAVSMRNR